MKALVWPVATYGCENWTFRKNKETSDNISLTMQDKDIAAMED